MGIPAALLPRIFDLFVQGERTLDRARRRAGHRPDAGARAGAIAWRQRRRRKLGRRQPLHRADRRRVAGAGTAGGETLPPSRRRQVLVVEDNDDAAGGAALRSSSSMVTRVSTAVDGIEGLSRLLKHRPEVSIVDIGLPGLTGFELARPCPRRRLRRAG